MERSETSWDVVLVDDDPRVRRMLAYVLEREELLVREHEAPLIALEHVIAAPPPVLITDLQMPELDGAGLAAAVRSQLGRRCPRILLVTGDPGALRPRDRVLFDRVLQKPWDREVLLEVVLPWVRPLPAVASA